MQAQDGIPDFLLVKAGEQAAKERAVATAAYYARWCEQHGVVSPQASLGGRTAPGADESVVREAEDRKAQHAALLAARRLDAARVKRAEAKHEGQVYCAVVGGWVPMPRAKYDRIMEELPSEAHREVFVEMCERLGFEPKVQKVKSRTGGGDAKSRRLQRRHDPQPRRLRADGTTHTHTTTTVTQAADVPLQERGRTRGGHQVATPPRIHDVPYARPGRKVRPLAVLDESRLADKERITLRLIKRPEGASYAEICAATGWSPKTPTAVLTKFRQGGVTITKATEEGRGVVFRVTP